VVHPYLDLPTPVVIGHRGCAGEVPDNTLPSFAAGLEAGAAILESDVHLSRDGVPVLIHDDDLERVSDGSGRVAEHSLAQLRRLDFGHRFSPDAGRSHPWRGRGVRIATLQEALAAFPAARFNLELKEDVPGMVERTAEVVAAAAAERRTLLTAAADALMAKLRAFVASEGLGVALGASTGEVVAFVRAAQAGVPPPPGPMALQVPDRFGEAPLVTELFVRHAHAHALHVHVWTINEPDAMTRLLHLGVDGLVTDHPRRMAALIG
jgi:glycerophosphoryl diester phosphodiesterase